MRTPPIDPIPFGQLRLSAVERTHTAVRVITGAGLARAGKNYHAFRTGEFNCRTSENSYVIASIEAPLKSAAWRSKFVICQSCATFFEIFLFDSVVPQ
jgi:hypothetical protein